jgi:hypothetical protein
VRIHTERYPAGKDKYILPPNIFVRPPSSGSTVMDVTLAPVQVPTAACPNSCKATVKTLKGHRMCFRMGVIQRIEIPTAKLWNSV